MTAPRTSTGTLTDGRTIVLDQKLPHLGRVRLVVEPLDNSPSPLALQTILDDLTRRQAARGYVPRTREEIDNTLRIERESWDD